MTYLLLEVQAIVNAQPLCSRPAPMRTWRDRASDAEVIEVVESLDAYRYLASQAIGAELAGAL